MGISGHNQYNNTQFTYINTPTPWTKQNWWWKYRIQLNSFAGYNGAGMFIGPRYPYIPLVYSLNNSYFKVYAY